MVMRWTGGRTGSHIRLDSLKSLLGNREVMAAEETGVLARPVWGLGQVSSTPGASGPSLGPLGPCWCPTLWDQRWFLVQDKCP